MKRYCYIELSIFTDKDFNPWQFYKILGIKPSFCKLSNKDEIVLLSKDWRQKLDVYINSCQHEKTTETLKALNYYKLTSPIFTKKISENIANYTHRLRKKNAKLEKIKKTTSCFFVLYLCGNFEGLIPSELVSYCHDHAIRLGISND